MKKFLTVLLVIAVMFTFSFSSAFAAPSDPVTLTAAEYSQYSAALDYAMNLAKANYEKATADGLYVKNSGTYSVEAVSDSNTGGVEVTKEAWAALEADFLDAIEENADLTTEAGTAYTITEENYGKVTSWTASVETIATQLFAGQQFWFAGDEANASGKSIKNALVADNDNMLAVAKKQFELSYADAYTLLDTKIDTAAYDAADLAKVNKAIAKIEKELDWYYLGATSTETGSSEIKSYKDVTVDFATLLSTYFTQVEVAAAGKTMETVNKEIYDSTKSGYTALSNKADSTVADWQYTGRYLITKDVDGNAIKTLADKAFTSPQDSATVASLKAAVTKAAADFIADVVADDQIGEGKAFKTLAAAQEYAESYKTVMNHLIDEELVDAVEVYVPDSHKLYSTGTNEPAAVDGTPGWVVATNQVTELGDYAKLYKAEKDATGALVRDGAAIDKIVGYATTDIYATKFGVTPYTPADSTMVTAYTLGTAKTAILNATVSSEAASLAFDKEVAKVTAKNDYEDIVDNYYALEAEKVKAAYEARVSAIEAAIKDADITAATSAWTKALKTIKTASAIYDSATGTGEFVSVASIAKEIDDQWTALNNYCTYANSGLKAYDKARIICVEAFAKDMLRTYYAEAGARTAAEIKAMALSAADAAAKLPTVGAKEEAIKNADAALKALPATSKVTLADEAAILNAKNAYEAAKDLGATDADLDYEANLTAAQTGLKNAYEADLWKKYSTTNKADKTALRALQDEIAAYNDLAGDGEVLEALTGVATFDIAPIADDLTKIRKEELKAVNNAIAALPINITEADKAQVEAARKLYDEYVADWTSYDPAFDASTAANGIENFRKLALAEATLGLNAPDPEENAKAYVQDLSIKARSTKTSKGVKVTINADVQPLLDDGFTVEYKFYRSTKSNKNFGTAKVTKTENTYLNTAGKKGTKYYYKAKLVVKNAAGEVVATTPLTQCLYATRTF